ncbi:flagellar protein FliT [Quatrionicoccus australiensis]|uniref:flagellar protein FliT n=1 Tax=Quatrionicoccus australiensis TaxID=138118 RepID=UPI001CF9AF00|nr:flagellar protein FliT [Quatrionicoccus australiensis]MCB4360893.1 flagellar protein FliT [Quatrionicoccus australiensis]
MPIAPELARLEQTFQEMLLAAKSENWALLASLENDSRSMLLNIEKSKVSRAQLKASLQRLLDCNQEITRRAKDRRSDIAFLLDAFAASAPGANG